jgi:hypothetical protein
MLTVGFSTGLICLLDMRTGWIQEGWKTCDSEILQVSFLSFLFLINKSNKKRYT